MKLLDEGFPPFESYRDIYVGLPMIHDPANPAGVAWILSAFTWDGETFVRQLADYLDRVDTTQVRALVVGEWDDPHQQSADLVVNALVAHADRFPALRALFLGDISSEQCEISWIQQGDITPLLEAFPELMRLDVRGSAGLDLRPVHHAALRVLRLESGGLPGHVVRAVGACSLPSLEHLELWLGVSNYGGDATVDDLSGILAGQGLPALRRLGLRNSEIQDQVAAVVAAAPVVARLEALSLSEGTLSDEGGEALLSGQPLTHLRLLDLGHHYLSDPMAERLVTALPSVTVELEERGPRYDFDPGGRYVAVSE